VNSKLKLVIHIVAFIIAFLLIAGPFITGRLLIV
jgi:hypothetical protein